MTKFSCAFSSFVAGFSLMTLELVSSRIVAPLIGTSVYTWTTVIGITLLGLSIGSYCGGIISDRLSTSHTLPVVFGISALTVGLLPFLSQKTQFILASFNSLPLTTLLVSLYLFLIPATAIGFIQPVVVKKFIDEFSDLGKKYGWLSALWSMGSIIGVFATGFFFISHIGSRETIYLISLLLACMGMLTAGVFREKRIFILVTAIFICVAIFLYIDPILNRNKGVIHSEETAYFSAKVIDTTSSQHGSTRVLMLDYDSHSIEAPEPLRSTKYTAVAPLFRELNRSHKIEDILVIGAGAYTLPKDLKRVYPESKITVLEIDPAVVQISKDYFDLDTSLIDTKIGDARILTKQMTSNYDLIFAGAFSSFISVPGHLLTQEYTRDMRNLLSNNGIYAINFISSVHGEHSSMFESVLATFKTVFTNYHVLHWNSDLDAIQNVVIVGVNGPLHISEELLIQRLSKSSNPHLANTVLVDPEIYSKSDALILTDNFHPVERLMASAITSYYPRFREYSESLYR